jgi:hypothetical protein
MPRSPTTEQPRAEVDVARTFDEALGVHAVFVAIPRAETVYFRLIVESWDGVAVERTMQRRFDADPSMSVVVVMAVPDFAGACARGLARLLPEVGGRQIEPSPELREALRRDLLG